MSDVDVVITVLTPTVPETEATKKNPTWVFDEGFVVARSDDRCPVFGDVVPYKSVTVIVPMEREADAQFSLEYVHGGGSVSARKAMGDMVALRSDYQCW
jgi:hypothetical protein